MFKNIVGYFKQPVKRIGWHTGIDITLPRVVHWILALAVVSFIWLAISEWF